MAQAQAPRSFSACNIEKLGGAWGRGGLQPQSPPGVYTHVAREGSRIKLVPFCCTQFLSIPALQTMQYRIILAYHLLPFFTVIKEGDPRSLIHTRQSLSFTGLLVY